MNNNTQQPPTRPGLVTTAFWLSMIAVAFSLFITISGITKISSPETLAEAKKALEGQGLSADELEQTAGFGIMFGIVVSIFIFALNSGFTLIGGILTYKGRSLGRIFLTIVLGLSTIGLLLSSFPRESIIGYILLLAIVILTWLSTSTEYFENSKKLRDAKKEAVAMG